MKTITYKLFVIAFILLGWSRPGMAQDNNILAKIAYESAEEALAAGNTHEAYSELNKVDSLLKKVTPKSLYLRVQFFNQAVKEDPQNLESAISVCNRYLALSKSFDMPEDKMMEVTKLRINLEKEKEKWDNKNKEEEKVAARVKFFMDSLYQSCRFTLGMTEENFIKANPELVKKMDVKKDVGGKWYQNYNGDEGYEGPIAVYFEQGVVSLYTYRYKTSGKKNTYEVENEFRYKLKPLFEAVIPKEVFENNSADYVKINFDLGSTSHLLLLQLGDFRKAKTIDITIQSFSKK
jgi:hypothetical protein